MDTRKLEQLITEMGFILVRMNGHKTWAKGIVRVVTTHKKQMSRPIVKSILRTIGYARSVPEAQYYV